MVFWNQTYSRFDQVTLPVNTIAVQATDLIQAYFENPSLRLWAERFASEQQVEFQNIQVRAMRPLTDKPITTNATGLATNSVDAYASCRTLDLYAFDYYPSLLDPISLAPYAFARGVKHQPFWLLEFVSGGGHRLSGSGRSQAWPGALQQSVVHAAANGASLVAHFQFRTFPFGAEQLNYAIVDADGIVRRRYHECADTAEVLKRLSPWLEDSRLDCRVALLFGYDALWALHMKPVNPDFTPLGYLEQLVRELASFGVSADVLDVRQIPETPKQYRLVVLPDLIVFDRESQARLKAYTASGGHVAASFLTSVKNRDNVGYTEPLPSGLQDLFGLAVAEVDPVFPHTVSAVETTGATVTRGQTASWLECLELNGAEAWAEIPDGFRRGAAVVARHNFGRGLAWYCGTRLSKNLAWAFWQAVLTEAALLAPELAAPAAGGLPADSAHASRWHLPAVCLQLHPPGSAYRTERFFRAGRQRTSRPDRPVAGA
jgi:beta-galactosidase